MVKIKDLQKIELQAGKPRAHEVEKFAGHEQSAIF